MLVNTTRGRSPSFHILYQAAMLTFVVLAVTGVFLLFFYQPSAAAGWGGLYDRPITASTSQTVQLVHRWCAYLLVPLTFATAFAGLIQKGLSLGRRLGVLVLPVLTGAALGTGFLLPWEQIALHAVRVGTSMSGYWLIFDDRVKFFLVNQHVVGLGTMAWSVVSHLAISLVIAAILVFTRSKTSADERYVSGG